MENEIKQIFIDLGADLCGIASIDRFDNSPEGFHPKDLYEACNAVIVFAKRLPRGIGSVSPRILYNTVKDTNIQILDHISYSACLEMEKHNCIAVPVPSDSPYEYWDAENKEGKGVLSMRHAAQLAGLGTIGKNSLLTNSKYGNMIQIGAVLTNEKLKSDPLAESVCGENCKLCVEKCPQHAISNMKVNQKLCREYSFENNLRGFSVCNCNTCRTVCPNAFGIKQKTIRRNP